MDVVEQEDCNGTKDDSDDDWDMRTIISRDKLMSNIREALRKSSFKKKFRNDRPSIPIDDLAPTDEKSQFL